MSDNEIAGKPVPLPTPYQLAALAVLLQPEAMRAATTDAARERVLGEAYAVWKAARGILERDGMTAVEVGYAKMLDEAGRSDVEAAKRYNWNDGSICLGVFGKIDVKSDKVGQRVNVTDDAIRHQLKNAFGSLGNAVFCWVSAHGITAGAAGTLKDWIAEAKETEREQEPYSPHDFSHRLLADESSADPALSFSAVQKALIDHMEGRKVGGIMNQGFGKG